MSRPSPKMSVVSPNFRRQNFKSSPFVAENVRGLQIFDVSKNFKSSRPSPKMSVGSKFSFPLGGGGGGGDVINIRYLVVKVDDNRPTREVPLTQHYLELIRSAGSKRTRR